MRSEGELAEKFMALCDGKVSDFEKKNASGAFPTEFPTKGENDGKHQIMTEEGCSTKLSLYRF